MHHRNAIPCFGKLSTSHTLLCKYCAIPACYRDSFYVGLKVTFQDCWFFIGPSAPCFLYSVQLNMTIYFLPDNAQTEIYNHFLPPAGNRDSGRIAALVT